LSDGTHPSSNQCKAALSRPRPTTARAGRLPGSRARRRVAPDSLRAGLRSCGYGVVIHLYSAQREAESSQSSSQPGAGVRAGSRDRSIRRYLPGRPSCFPRVRPDVRPAAAVLAWTGRVGAQAPRGGPGLTPMPPLIEARAAVSSSWWARAVGAIVPGATAEQASRLQAAAALHGARIPPLVPDSWVRAGRLVAWRA
jgi:hypothetical protein